MIILTIIMLALGYALDYTLKSIGLIGMFYTVISECLFLVICGLAMFYQIKEDKNPSELLWQLLSSIFASLMLFITMYNLYFSAPETLTGSLSDWNQNRLLMANFLYMFYTSYKSFANAVQNNIKISQLEKAK